MALPSFAETKEGRCGSTPAVGRPQGRVEHVLNLDIKNEGEE
jgi:hypothetical protein